MKNYCLTTISRFQYCRCPGRAACLALPIGLDYVPGGNGRLKQGALSAVKVSLSLRLSYSECATFCEGVGLVNFDSLITL